MKPVLYINSYYPSIRFVWLPLWIEYRPRDHYYKWPTFSWNKIYLWTIHIWIGFGTLRIHWG